MGDRRRRILLVMGRQHGVLWDRAEREEAGTVCEQSQTNRLSISAYHVYSNQYGVAQRTTELRYAKIVESDGGGGWNEVLIGGIAQLGDALI